ncbi:MAG TPA: hypothetical protein PKV66_00335 [Candidatus Pelethenecus sp.]|nr:hypothetical protein [Candidatus Pelethenecus sp.]
MIVQGSQKDLLEYQEIYIKYINKVYSNLLFSDKEISQLIKRIDTMKKLESGLNSPLCRVLFIKEKDTIGGFLEAYIIANDYMFEKKHIYIANLFIDKDIISEELTFSLSNQMLLKIEEWAKELQIEYICNDVDESNIVMKKLNKVVKFMPYRTRYYKRITLNE